MTEQFINQPITVQVRFQSDGRVHPTAFVWQGRTRYLTELGRQWREKDDQGVGWHCFLARTASGDTVELRWQVGDNQWLLWRAWWRYHLA